MAARDTTASLLTSTIYELSRNQTIQTQAREEILSLLGKEGALAYDDVKSLKLVRAIIDETLR
jgi:cytochrome P450